MSMSLGGHRPARPCGNRHGVVAHDRRTLGATGDRGFAATNALELGIDIAGLDAIVLNGFPGTLASMWQQVGRAGRSGRRAAAVLVAGDDQLDQWYAAHPDQLVHRAAEAVVVNPDNPYVAHAQIACAAHELPLTHEVLAMLVGAHRPTVTIALQRLSRAECLIR